MERISIQINIGAGIVLTSLKAAVSTARMRGVLRLAIDSSVRLKQHAVGLMRLSGLLRTLGEENRMRILCFLMQGEHSVCDLAACLHLSQNLVSHHLGVLRGLGLVVVRHDERDARLVYYSVDRAALAQLNALYQSFFAADRVGPWQRGCCTENECCSECLINGSC